MKNLISITLTSMILFVGAASAADLDSGSHSEKKGSTSVRGNYRLYVSENQQIKLDVHFSVKKTGMFGTGKGAMAIGLIGADGSTLFQYTKGLTVGARVPEGVARKNDDQSLTIIGPLAQKLISEGGYVAFHVDAVSDSIGIPTSLSEWKSALGDIIPAFLNGFGSGYTKEVSGWILKKIIK